MKQQRKEFIIQAHSAACSEWKEKIESEFPKLFKKDELVVGQWYKLTKGYCDLKKDSVFPFIKYQFEDSKKYAILGHSIFDRHNSAFYAPNVDQLTPATDKEVSEALISEAKKRGYKNGNYKCLSNYFPTNEKVKDVFFIRDGCLFVGLTENCNIIFQKGIWAEIIEDPVYEWQYVYDGLEFGITEKSNSYYTSKKEFKSNWETLKPIKKVKGSKRIRK